MKRIVMCEYAPDRGDAFRQWLPAVQIVRRHLGEVVPASFDAIILGGGPMSAAAEDREKYPFLKEDYALIQRCVQAQAGGPLVVGICLGAQLVATAFGGEVVNGETIRGWNVIVPVVVHPMFQLGTPCVQFEFHSNHIVKLPIGAELLATSNKDAIEAFRIGSRVLGTAYHPEVAQVDAERIYCKAHLEPHELHMDQFIDPGSSARTSSQAFFRALFG